jgi:hypothetical protein
VAVFLRWLIVDLIVIRLLRRHRLRRYANRSYAVSQQHYPGPMGGVRPPNIPTYHYVRRRRRLSCCSGCLILVAAMTLGVILVAALGHWLF